MNTPSFPLDFGSWQEHLNLPPNQVWGPDPSPWKFAVSYVVSTLSLKEAASQIQDEQIKGELIGQINASIQAFTDGYCKTPTRPNGPFGPHHIPSWVQSTVSELVFTANSLQEGSLRHEILTVAGTMLQTALR